jgi:hypothetical protein
VTLAINYGRKTGRGLVAQAMILNSQAHKLQQRQRRIFERCGAHVSMRELVAATAPDHLEHRAMWRRCGRALCIRSTCIGGKFERFLAP